MKARKKLFISIAAGLGIVLFIIVLGLFLVSLLVNLDSTKKKIITKISERIGGQVNYADFDFSLLPLPHVTIRKGSLLVNEKARGSFEKISVYPEVLPLFKGEVKPYSVSISSPSITLTIPERDKQENGIKKQFSINEVWKVITLHLMSLASKAPDLVFEVKDGNINLIEKDRTVFWFRDIQARIAVPSDQKSIAIKCKSNLGERFSVTGSINLKKLLGNGRIELYKFRLAALYEYLLPSSSYKISDSVVNLDLNLHALGQNHLKARFAGSIPNLSVQEEKGEFLFEASNLEGELEIDEGKSNISFHNTSLDNPKLKLAGSFLQDSAANMVELRIQAKEVDIKSVREAALFLFGRHRISRKIFEIIKGGYSPLTEFSSKAHSIYEIGQEGNFIIRGQMQDGKVYIPAADLDLTHASGHAVVSHGILEGEKLEGRAGNTRGYNGNLRLGLSRKHEIFKLDVSIDGDLSELPPYLSRYITSEDVKKEISLIHDLKGNAQANLVLGDTKSSIKAKIKAREINLSANYNRIPYPIEIKGGQFLFDMKRVDLDKLNLSLGKSRFTGLSGWVDWHETTDFNIQADESKILLNELQKWLSSTEGIGRYTKYLRAFNGSIVFSSLMVEGPLLEPGQWNINMQGEGILSDKTGPNVSLDFLRTAEQFVINELTIDDEESNAIFEGKANEKVLEMNFIGNLTENTLSNVFSHRYLSDGWLKGNIKARIMKDQPAASFAEGNLDGENLVSPMILDEAFRINRISLEAKKNQLNVKSLALSLGDTHLDIEGNVTSTEEGFQLMFDASSDLIEWENIKAALDRHNGERNRNSNDVKWDLPIKGTFGLTSENFRYDRFNWSPFNAEMKFDGKTINIIVSDATLCGIDTPGVIKITPSDKNLDFELTSSKQQLGKTIRCLFEKEKIISGDFDIDGQVKADVKNELSARSLQGNVNLSARNGRIYHQKFLLKILDIMRIVNLRLPDFGNKGLVYKSLDLKGNLKNGSLMLEDSILDSPTMAIVIDGDVDLPDKKVDLKLKVAPIKIMNFATTKIPILKRIRGGHLLSIPVRIKGNLGDAEVNKDE